MSIKNFTKSLNFDIQKCPSVQCGDKNHSGWDPEEFTHDSTPNKHQNKKGGQVIVLKISENVRSEKVKVSGSNSNNNCDDN